MVAGLGIAVEFFRDAVDQLYNELGHVITGSRLPGKYDGSRHRRAGRLFFDPVVQGDGVEHAQQLPFVFVDTLDLNIEQGVRIQSDFNIIKNIF